MSARRAVVRWSVRLFRREWRQQLLVLGLVTVAVAAAVFGTALTYHAPSPQQAEFGRASARARLEPNRAGAIDNTVRDAFPSGAPYELITHRSVGVPGSTESLDVRAQDPHGRFGAPLVALRKGRYPVARDEVAMTTNAAKLLDTKLGSTVAIGDAPRRVVGIVENPTGLSDRFILEPIGAGTPVFVDVLFNATRDTVPAGLRPTPDSRGSAANVIEISLRGSTNDNVAAAGIGFAMATIVMLLVALVAAAGFVVIAQRRSRQLGMMAATGATDRHLRLVLVANGAIVGLAAAVAGTLLALVMWIVELPRLQVLVGHRFGRFDIPLWIVALGTLLAVLTATAAAWWPARVVARTPIVTALSGRPPAPRPVHRSTLGGVLMVAGGVAALNRGIDVKHDHATAWLVAVGTIAIAVGILLVAPAAVRLCGRVASSLPVGARVALRDIARYQARSSAALAAISLGLGIAIAVITISSAAEPTPGTGNLSSHQLLFTLHGTSPTVFVGKDPGSAPVVNAAALQRATDGANQVAAAIGGAHVVPLVGAALPSGGAKNNTALLLRRMSAQSFRYVDQLFVATPEVLRYLHLDAAVAASADVITSQTGALFVVTSDSRPERAAVAHVRLPAYTSAPRALITERGVQRFGLTPVPDAWLVEATHAISSASASQARRVAAASGLLVETRHVPAAFATARTIATVAGALLALGVLAMTVGLIRSEAAADVRTLAATGATSGTRRALSATTAGALALLAALVGTLGAYAALLAGYADRLKPLEHVPVTNLLIIVLGVPLLAAAAGWLLAGREPPTMSRQLVVA